MFGLGFTKERVSLNSNSPICKSTIITEQNILEEGFDNICKELKIKNANEIKDDEISKSMAQRWSGPKNFTRKVPCKIAFFGQGRDLKISFFCKVPTLGKFILVNTISRYLPCKNSGPLLARQALGHFLRSTQRW